MNPDGILAAEGLFTYFTFPQDVARVKLNFPDPEDFFEE
jgi:hypothetical protein